MNFSSDHFDVKQSLESEEPIRFSMDFATKPGSVSLERYEAMLEGLDRAEVQPTWKIHFRTDNTVNAASEGVSSTKSIEDLINAGKYKLAKQKLEQRIKTQNNLGESFYLLGVVYGYLGEFTLSQEQFKNARQEGYRP